MPALVVTRGSDAGLFVPLAKRAVVVGRDQAANLQVNDEKASRKHAQVRWDETAAGYLVTDMKSRNGTLLNGRAFTDEAPLAFGSTISIGDTDLMLIEEVPTDKANALDVVKRVAERHRSTIMHGR